MESAGYFSIFRERWLVILFVALVGFGVAFGAANSIEKTYQADATMFLQVDAPTAGLNEQSQFSLSRIKSYGDLVSSPDLLSGVISSLGLDLTPAQLKKQLSAVNPVNTVLLVVTAKADDPDIAADIANAAAAGLSKKVSALENSSTDSRYTINLDVTLPAQVPGGPSAPNVPVIIGLGAITGLSVGLIAAIVLERTRPRVRTANDVRRITGLPLVAQLPRRLPLGSTVSSLNSRAVDMALRTAASNLRAISRGHLPPVIALVPVGTRPARASTRLGIARGLATTGRDVALIESDVDAQRLAKFPITESVPGLSETLIGETDVADTILTLDEYPFRVLPAGSPESIPSEFVTEQNIARVMTEVAQSVDVAVLQVAANTRPLPLAALAPVVSGALLVTSFSRTSARQLRRELSLLRILNIVPIGIIMTDVPGHRQTSLLETWQAQDFVTVSTADTKSSSAKPAAAKPRSRSRTTAASRARATANAPADEQTPAEKPAAENTPQNFDTLNFVDSESPANPENY